MGKYDADIWGIEIGRIYKETDKKTLRLKGTHYIAEDPIIIQGDDVTQKWKVIKYLRYVGKIVVGIGGIAIPYEGK